MGLCDREMARAARRGRGYWVAKKPGLCGGQGYAAAGSLVRGQRLHAAAAQLRPGRATPACGPVGARSGQVEFAVLDAEGERFPLLGREREHRAVRLRGVAHQVQLLRVRLVRPAGSVGGDRDFHAVGPGPAVAGPAPARSV